MVSFRGTVELMEMRISPLIPIPNSFGSTSQYEPCHVVGMQDERRNTKCVTALLSFILHERLL